MSAALPSIIAMKKSFRHSDDLNIIHKPTLLEELEAALWVAEGMIAQRQWSERIANSGELLKLEYLEQLTILDAIDEGFIKPVEISINPNSEIV